MDKGDDSNNSSENPITIESGIVDQNRIKDSRDDKEKNTKSRYYIPNFDFLRLIKDHYQLFSVFGIFGAIAVYLNSLIKISSNVKISNPPLTLIDIVATWIDSIYEFLINTNIQSLINILLKEPYRIISINFPNDTNEAFLNIGVVASLAIFIIIGYAIWKLYKLEYESLNSSAFDMLLGPSFVILIVIIATYIIINLLTYNYMIIIILLFVSQFLCHIISRFFKIYEKMGIVTQTKASTYVFYLTHIITFYVALLMVTLLIGIKLNSNVISNILFIFLITIISTIVYLIYSLANKEFRDQLFKEDNDDNSDDNQYGDEDFKITVIVSFIFFIFTVIIHLEPILRSQIGMLLLPISFITFLILPIIINKYVEWFIY